MLPLFSHGKPNDSWREELRIWDKICTCVVAEFRKRDLSNIHCSTTTSLVFWLLQENHCWSVWEPHCFHPSRAISGCSCHWCILSEVQYCLSWGLIWPYTSHALTSRKDRLATVHGSIEKMLPDPEQTDKWIWVFSCVSQRDQYSRI